MSKILPKIFPFFDFLYIFQILEYNLWDFFVWSLKNYFKRNLQRKHNLELTKKAVLILIIGLSIAVLTSILISQQFLLISYPIVLLLLIQLLSPFFILLAQIFILPFETYQKNKIITKATQKLRKMSQLRVIAITGSYGKTSTKDILYTLIWKKYRVVKTLRSYNNPLSLAQTIIDFTKSNTDIFIAEVGAYKKGEIKKIGAWLKPDVSVITAVAPQHLEKFGSIENIAMAKFELVESLDKNGLAIINSENQILIDLSKNSYSKTIYYNDDNYFVSDIKVLADGTSFTLNTPAKSIPVKIPMVGEHHAKNFLAAATVALKLGLTLDEIAKRASLIQPTPHRLEIKRQGNVTIIDNSYNTNPESSKSSLKLLNNLPGKQKIIITPGLVELGKECRKENIQFAKNLSKVATEVIIVGNHAKKYLIEGLNEEGYLKNNIHLVSSTKNGISLAIRLTQNKSTILIENDLPDQYF